MYPKKICFVALRAYPLLAKRNMGFGGGPEILQTFLGRSLLENGFDVTFIVYGGSSGTENIGGIDVIKVPYENKSRILKSIFIWKAMKTADADIYYHHSGAAPIVALFCGLNKKKFLWHVSSDGCVVRSTKGYNIWWLDMKLASMIIVQSNFQKIMLKKNFNRDSVLIKNIFPVTADFSSTKPVSPTILWAGAMAHVKQPWLFLKLAERIPEGKFQMAGGVGDDERLHNFIERESRKIPNLDLLGYIPFDDIDSYFEKAAILVNTSKFEGYPNAFIQSWRHCSPVVSLNADPDEVICRLKLGFHSRTFEQLVKDVRKLLKDKDLRIGMGENARRYVCKEHDIHEITAKYITVLKSL